MEFMNIVRVKVKQDHMDEYMQLNEEFPIYEGQIMSRLVKTGDNTFCYVGIWESEDAIAAQRDAMIEGLDKMRHTLEEISPDLGVTDPVSGPVVIAKKKLKQLLSNFFFGIEKRFLNHCTFYKHIIDFNIKFIC